MVVPYGPKAQWPDSDLHIGGALFADDAVGLVEDLEAARLFCDRITRWTEDNEMEVGISKCGILEFLEDPTEDPILTVEHPERDSIMIGNKVVPVVDEYKYLGLRVTTALDPSSLIAGRLKKGNATAHAVKAYLRCSTIPMRLRLDVVRAVVLPRCLYGAEIFGMNRALTAKVQAMVNVTLRSILGLFGGKHWVPSAPLWVELGVPPVCAIAAARRARAYRKCFILRTVIGRMIRHPMGSRKWTWSNGTIRWIQRHCRPHMLARYGEADLPNFDDLSPEDASAVVQACITEREHANRRKEYHRWSEPTNWYFEVGQFEKQSLTKAGAGCPPRDVQGLALLVRARIGALRLAPALVAAHILDAPYATVCPFCNLPEPETMYHLIFVCPSWNRLRRLHLGGILRTIRQLSTHPAAANLNCPLGDASLSWVLGGTQGGLRVRRWGPVRPSRTTVLRAEARRDQPQLEATHFSSSSSSEPGSDSDSSSSVGAQVPRGRARFVAGVVVPPCISVGRYLRIVMRKRARTISARTGTAVGHLDITPASATGQRPDG